MEEQLRQWRERVNGQVASLQDRLQETSGHLHQLSTAVQDLGATLGEKLQRETSDVSIHHTLVIVT